jgi:hypothetical protein
MFGVEILEVAIGVIFIFLLVSILCTAVREGIETMLKMRSVHLEQGIRELLNDRDATDLARNLYQHPLIFGLFPGDYQPTPASGRGLGRFVTGGNLPSYIPARNFALALMDVAARGPVASAATSGPNATAMSAQSIRENIQNIVNPAIQRVLLTALDEARDDVDRARKNVEAWFDSAMDRVSGQYKRETQKIIFWVGLLLAVVLNIDTVRIADYLYRNDAARAAIVARAEKAVGDTAYLRRTYEQARAELDTLRFPTGWAQVTFAPKGRTRPNFRQDPVAWTEYSALWAKNLLVYVLLALFGWLATAAAATLGAPFWFDVLNKVMVIRSTVKPREKSPEEASEDRQLKPAGKAEDTRVTDATATAPPDAVGSPPDPTGDEEEHLDSCGIEEALAATSDEDLPPAEGGVA